MWNKVIVCLVCLLPVVVTLQEPFQSSSPGENTLPTRSRSIWGSFFSDNSTFLQKLFPKVLQKDDNQTESSQLSGESKLIGFNLPAAITTVAGTLGLGLVTLGALYATGREEGPNRRGWTNQGPRRPPPTFRQPPRFFVEEDQHYPSASDQYVGAHLMEPQRQFVYSGQERYDAQVAQSSNEDLPSSFRRPEPLQSQREYSFLNPKYVRPQRYHEELPEQNYVTVDQVNKIADDSLQDILSHYEQVMKKKESLNNPDFESLQYQDQTNFAQERTDVQTNFAQEKTDVYGPESVTIFGDDPVRSADAPQTVWHNQDIRMNNWHPIEEDQKKPVDIIKTSDDKTSHGSQPQHPLKDEQIKYHNAYVRLYSRNPQNRTRIYRRTKSEAASVQE